MGVKYDEPRILQNRNFFLNPDFSFAEPNQIEPGPSLGTFWPFIIRFNVVEKDLVFNFDTK